MSKSLVIVESPAKAKTISKYLGSEYIVKSSVGHIRDLPKGKSKTPAKRNQIPKDISAEEKARLKKINKRKADVKRWGIDPEDGWKGVYEIIPGKEMCSISWPTGGGMDLHSRAGGMQLLCFEWKPGQ